jgi:hypothetical protein
MSQQPFYFRRPALAAHLADKMDGSSPLGAEPTICLAAPRRTGKSTFLRDDLIPLLENRNILPIYVDLWADAQRDPAEIIGTKIADALRASAPLARRVAQNVGLTKIGVSGTSIDVASSVQIDGMTLPDALERLLRQANKRIALLIDEAQHALKSEQGLNAMFALKSARDQLNTRPDGRDGINLSIVLTGSHRDKLSRLANRRSMPFFGTVVTPFPLLDRGYVEEYAKWANQRLNLSAPIRAEDLHQQFVRLGHRPEMLTALLRNVIFSSEDAPLPELLRTATDDILYRQWDEFEGAWEGFSPLQRAILSRLAEAADSGPFTASALAFYRTQTEAPVEASAVQAAIEALRERHGDEEIIWKPARGEYVLSDQNLGEWIKGRLMEDEKMASLAREKPEFPDS